MKRSTLIGAAVVLAFFYAYDRIANPPLEPGQLAWNIDGEISLTDMEKAHLKQGAAMVLDQNRRCAAITTGYRSGSRPGSYYVTCDRRGGGHSFNVWFSPDEL